MFLNSASGQGSAFSNLYAPIWWSSGPIKQLSDGGFGVPVGTYNTGAGDFEISFLRIDSIGNIVWNKTYSTPQHEQIWNWIETSDGGFVFIGSIHTVVATSQIYILKLDSGGNLIWSKKFNNLIGRGNFIYERANGNFTIIGQSWATSLSTPADIIYLTIDSTGTVLNAKLFDTSESEVIWDVCHTNDGGVIINGDTKHPCSNSLVPYLLKIDSLGNIEWEKIIKFGNCIGGQGASVIQTVDGSYIAGLRGPYGSITSVIKFDSSGNLNWCKSYTPAVNVVVELECIREINGDFIFTDWMYDPSNSNLTSFFTKIDSSGNVIWTKYFSDPNGIQYFFEEFTVSSDNSIVMSGILKDSTSVRKCFVQKFPNYTIDNLCDINSISNSATSNTVNIDSGFFSTVISNITTTDVITFVFDTIYSPNSLCLYTSLDEITSEIELNIYPNPAETYITIQAKRITDIEIINTLGELSIFRKINSNFQNEIQLDISSLPSGIYFVRMGNEVRKFIKGGN